VADAKQSLNGLFNEAEYPKAHEIERKFGFEITVRPVPDAGDFRVDLSADETNRIRQEIELSVENTVKAAMQDAFIRLRDVVGHMAERLTLYTEAPNGKVVNPFRDTVVTNITDLLDVLPSLNLTGSPELDAFADEVRSKLANFSPDQLRNSAVIRNSTKEAAAEILKKMEDFLK